MPKLWNSLYRKVRFAVLTAIPIDAVYFLAWLNGTADWKVALIGALATDTPLVVAWSVRETKASA